MGAQIDPARVVAHGQVIEFDKNLGPRLVKTAKKAGLCSGWNNPAGHARIEVGDLFVETETDPARAGGFAMQRVCLDCAGLHLRAVGQLEICPACKHARPATPSMIRSGNRTCMVCQGKKSQAWAKKNPEKHVQHVKNYYAKRPGLYNAMARKYRAGNRKKISAHNAVYRAIKAGLLERAPCVICGSASSLGHHDNYARPLDVVWLCNAHHIERHKSLGWGHA